MPALVPDGRGLSMRWRDRIEQNGCGQREQCGDGGGQPLEVDGCGFGLCQINQARPSLPFVLWGMGATSLGLKPRGALGDPPTDRTSSLSGQLDLTRPLALYLLGKRNGELPLQRSIAACCWSTTRAWSLLCA